MPTRSPVEDININAENGEREDTKEKEKGTNRLILNSIMLLSWILVLEGIAYFLYRVFPVTEWYENLVRSPADLPVIAFVILWVIMFANSALVGWFLSLGLKERAILCMFLVFWIQQVLNFAWIPTFLGYHQLVSALSIHGVAIVFTAILIVRLWTLKLEILGVKTRTIGMMMVPYFLWLSYVTHLSAYVVIMNPSEL